MGYIKGICVYDAQTPLSDDIDGQSCLTAWSWSHSHIQKQPHVLWYNRILFSIVVNRSYDFILFNLFPLKDLSEFNQYIVPLP